MKKETMEKVTVHGMALLAIFPKTTERDPVNLCRKLRRLEREGATLGLRLCNGPEFPGGYDEVGRLTDSVISRVNDLLGNADGGVPVFLNLDPRGYALKIRNDWMRANAEDSRLARDWGNYGIIAPDLN